MKAFPNSANYGDRFSGAQRFPTAQVPLFPRSADSAPYIDVISMEEQGDRQRLAATALTFSGKDAGAKIV